MAKAQRSAADLIGKQLLNYRITKKLGAGGQGDVYLALDLKLQRQVVLKILPAELTANEASLRRFEREARLASSLDHPNICSIYSFDSVDGMYFIAMQFVEGKNVRELVNGRPLELTSALSIATQVCDALAAAHGRAIIHRDIKANNIMVTADGQVKILDFGLAKLMEEDSYYPSDVDRKQLTEIGVPYGTATYAAPEQALGQKVDERCDTFSTGVLLYEMLTGTWPFDGKTTIDVRYKVVNEDPKPLADVRPTPVPQTLQEIVDRAIAKQPKDRYPKIAEMRDQLRILLNDISLSEDPSFIKNITPSAPRHLGGEPLRGFRSFLKKPAVTLAAVVVGLLGLAALSLWVFKPNLAATMFGGSNDNVILRLAGSNTIGAKLAPALVEEFLRSQGAKDISEVPGSNPEETTVTAVLPGDSRTVKVELRSHGSATAFTDLAQKKCDVGMASRKIKPDEAESLASFGDMTSPASEHIIALDGLAVIVNRNNTVNSLTKEQIAKIFSGEIRNWSQLLAPGGAINVYARDDKSGTFDSFQAMVLGRSKLIESAKRFEDSNELSDAVAGDANGIGFIGIPYIRDAKAVSVSDGDAAALVPNRLTVATEDYILSRRLYLYTPANSQNAWVRKFVDFVVSKAGQDLVSKNGFVAQTVESTKLSVSDSAPTEYKKLIADSERLSLNFRFRKSGKDLDNKAQLDLDRVVNFLSDSGLTGDKVILLGFADDGNDQNAELALSKERAAVVASELKRRGIAPGEVTGFGDYLPVASNASEDGREKNRRVELWLRK
jgi:phosphate transport system substrate-binding protein